MKLTLLRTLLACTLSASLSPAAQANGCIITQTDQASSLLLSSGSVSQSFTACRTGTLEYLTLFVTSNDAAHFTARISIHGSEGTVTRQQAVIPSAYTSDRMKLRLAAPPVVEAGKNYTITLEVPDGHTLNVGYTDADHYNEGNLSIDGQAMTGDLAFEAGVKAYSDRLMGAKSNGECQPMQLAAQDASEVKSIIAQSFTLCEGAEILGITLFYKSTVNFSGYLDLYRSGVSHDEVLGSLAFTASASPAGFVIATPTDELLLTEPDLYEFRFRDFTPEREDESVLFSTAQNNAYEEGALISALGATTDDLMFQVIYEAIETNATESSYELMSGYKNHECVLAQPFFNAHESYDSGTLRITLDICDDGKLEAVYLKASMETNDEPIRFTLLDDRGKIVRRGELSHADLKEGTLVIDLEDAPVVYYYKYILELDIPERSSLKLGSSDRAEAINFKASYNGRTVNNSIAVAVGMRPYLFEPIEESENSLAMTLFPNPFASQLFVDVHNIEGQRATVTLYGFHGAELFSTVITGHQATERVAILPEQHLERGFYTVRVESQGEVVIETAVKQ